MTPRGRPAAGGGRWVEVPPERMAGWLVRFAARHDGAVAHVGPTGLRLVGADGGTADCQLPLGWPDGLPAPIAGEASAEQDSSAGPRDTGTAERPTSTADGEGSGTVDGEPAGNEQRAAAEHGDAGPDTTAGRCHTTSAGDDTAAGVESATADAFLAAAHHPWRVGVLLVRRGAHAVGVVIGDQLVASKVDTRYVQGRTAAGGWSQQRFARRRENQTRESVAAAADHAARVLATAEQPLTGLVLGGDRALADALLTDRRLAGLAELPRAPFLDVPEPRHQTLLDAAQRYRAVRILLRDRPGR